MGERPYDPVVALFNTRISDDSCPPAYLATIPSNMRRLLPSTLLRQCRAPIPRPQPSLPLIAVRFAHSRYAKYRKEVNRARDSPPRVSKGWTRAEGATKLSGYTYESLHRTAPEDVYDRRQKWPAHRERSHFPLSDPDFRTGGPTIKRLPLDMEDEFDRYRASGLLPYKEDTARRDYLEISSEWRNRIRGTASLVWNPQTKRWVDKSKEVFFWREAKKRYPELVYPTLDTPIESIQELYLAGQVWPSADDLFVEELEKRYPGADPYEKLNNLRDDMDLVDWDAVAARTGTPEEDPQLWSRIRTRTVGYRAYLPNVQVVLRRNNTPVDQPYDPMIATFRIPLSMTKTDLRSYLYSCYGLEITFIRTDIRRGTIVRDPRNGRRGRQKGSDHNYKRAVVGLKEPFHYPDDVEELQAWGHSVGLGDKYKSYHEAFLDRMYGISENKKLRVEQVLKSHKVRKDPRKYRSIEEVTLRDDALPGGRVSSRIASGCS